MRTAYPRISGLVRAEWFCLCSSVYSPDFVIAFLYHHSVQQLVLLLDSVNENCINLMATEVALEMRPMNRTFGDDVAFDADGSSRYSPRNEPIRSDSGELL